MKVAVASGGADALPARVHSIRPMRQRVQAAAVSPCSPLSPRRPPPELERPESRSTAVSRPFPQTPSVLSPAIFGRELQHQDATTTGSCGCLGARETNRSHCLRPRLAADQHEARQVRLNRHSTRTQARMLARLTAGPCYEEVKRPASGRRWSAAAAARARRPAAAARRSGRPAPRPP